MTPLQVAYRMIDQHGKKAEEWATDHAFGNDLGPQRDFWLEVRAILPEVRKAIAEDKQGA